MKIYVGCDHTSVHLKNHLIKYLSAKKYTLINCGINSSDKKVDYPDFAEKVGLAIQQEQNAVGIVICGTGIGICIAANKIKGVRAALCTEPWLAKMTRSHNDANVLAIGSWVTPQRKAELIADNFLTTQFALVEKRHLQRVNKIKKLEK